MYLVTFYEPNTDSNKVTVLENRRMTDREVIELMSKTIDYERFNLPVPENYPSMLFEIHEMKLISDNS